MDASSIKFSLYHRKGSKNWQAQFRDATGHSIQKGTGSSSKLEALWKAADWQANSIPQGKTGVIRPLVDVFAVESVMDSIYHAPLTHKDATRIVDVLQARGLINVKIIPEAFEDTYLYIEYSSCQGASSHPNRRQPCP
jgi:hypothetical protein